MPCSCRASLLMTDYHFALEFQWYIISNWTVPMCKHSVCWTAACICWHMFLTIFCVLRASPYIKKCYFRQGETLEVDVWLQWHHISIIASLITSNSSVYLFFLGIVQVNSKENIKFHIANCLWADEENVFMPWPHHDHLNIFALLLKICTVQKMHSKS